MAAGLLLILASILGKNGELSAIALPLQLLSFAVILTQSILFILEHFRTDKVNNKTARTLKKEYIDKLDLAISDFARGNISTSIGTSFSLEASEIPEEYTSIADGLERVVHDFNTITTTPLNRLCYIGADSFQEGFLCGQNMSRLVSSKGNILILVNRLNNIGHYLRSRGFISALNTYAPQLTISAIEEEHESADLTFQITLDYLQKDPELVGIYITEGTTPYSAAKASESVDSSVKIVTHDITEKTALYINRGYIHSSLSQSPYLQGFNSLTTAFNFLATGEEPHISRILINLEEIQKKNLADHWQNEKGQLLTEESQKAKILPQKNENSKKIKIGFIVPGKKEFWEPVYQGAQEAAGILRQNSCEIEIVSLDSLPSKSSGEELFRIALSKLVEFKAEAICLPVYLPEIGERLNKLIAEGTVIVTYNSEPFNLRSILKTVVHATGKLFKFSEDMAANTVQSSKATSQISQTLTSIDSQTVNQLLKLQKTLEELLSLQSFVKESAKIVEKSMETGQKTVETAQNGSTMVKEGSQAADFAQSAMDGLSDLTGELSEKMQKIKEIISIINDMASQTNTIAINAGILAAKAGDEGKGFTVVASEIRKLASQSATHGEEISHIVSDLTTSMDETLQRIEMGQQSVNKSSEKSSEAAIALGDIIEATENNKKYNEEIKSLFTQMGEITENLQKSMNDLTGINQQNSDSIKEITQTANDISGQVVRDSKAAQQLSDMAESQNRVLAQYFDQENH